MPPPQRPNPATIPQPKKGCFDQLRHSIIHCPQSTRPCAAPLQNHVDRFFVGTALQEEQARRNEKRRAVLEERARAELDKLQNHAASQIQRVLRAYVARQALANKGKKGKKGKAGGKKAKKAKK